MTAKHSLRAILIAGPTASGKSALALNIARQIGSAIINADSMQVYREWNILTARPSDEDLLTAPHLLYGHVSLRSPYSMGHWLDEIKAVLPLPGSDEPPPVVTGGTGAYFNALTRGLAPIPRIPEEVRKRVEQELHERGLDSLADELSRLDPETAKGIALDNPRRVTRALEVLRHTGDGLAQWHQQTGPPLLRMEETEPLILCVKQDDLQRRVERRFDMMMRSGALAEVASVLESGKVPDGRWPLGGRELAAYLNGQMGKERAVERSIVSTMQYAKRQRTWFRSKMADWSQSNLAESSQLLGKVKLRCSAARL